MANMRYAVGRPFGSATTQGDFARVVATFASDEATGYAASNLGYEPIDRTWRSTGTGGTRYVGISLSATTDVAIQAVLVEGLNFTKFTIKGSTSAQGSNLATTGTSLATFTGTTLVANPRHGRYSTLAVYSGSYRYVGIHIDTTATTTDGGTAYEVGRITAIGTLRTMALNWSLPYRYSVGSAGEVTEFPGGGIETISSSRPFARFNLLGAFNVGNTSAVADANRFAAATKQDRILHFENRTADTQNVHAYYCMVQDEVSLEENFPTLSADVLLREVL